MELKAYYSPGLKGKIPPADIQSASVYFIAPYENIGYIITATLNLIGRGGVLVAPEQNWWLPDPHLLCEEHQCVCGQALSDEHTCPKCGARIIQQPLLEALEALAEIAGTEQWAFQIVTGQLVIGWPEDPWGRRETLALTGFTYQYALHLLRRFNAPKQANGWTFFPLPRSWVYRLVAWRLRGV